MYMYMYIVNVLRVCTPVCIKSVSYFYYNKINVHVHNAYLHVHVYTVHVIFNFLFSR